MKKCAAFFAVLGFVGAAAFYAPYAGIGLLARWACPVCPNITSVSGTPLARFVRFSLFGGFFNAIFFVAVGCVLVLLGRFLFESYHRGGKGTE